MAARGGFSLDAPLTEDELRSLNEQAHLSKLQRSLAAVGAASAAQTVGEEQSRPWLQTTLGLLPCLIVVLVLLSTVLLSREIVEVVGLIIGIPVGANATTGVTLNMTGVGNSTGAEV